MFRIEGLGPKMDPEELKRKMRRDVLTSVRNFLIYVALLRISKCSGRRGPLGTAGWPPGPAPVRGLRPRDGTDWPGAAACSRPLLCTQHGTPSSWYSMGKKPGSKTSVCYDSESTAGLQQQRGRLKHRLQGPHIAPTQEAYVHPNDPEGASQVRPRVKPGSRLANIMSGCGRGLPLGCCQRHRVLRQGGLWGLYTFLSATCTTATDLWASEILLVVQGPLRGWAWRGQGVPRRGWDWAPGLWEPAKTGQGWRGRGVATWEGVIVMGGV
ncbi:hypothetical protein QYF61_007198 [Mycteria americana]|uniref:Uncharacterized protein n=3 Tax=Neoaves TaxID=3078114 RepID=A0AAN7RTH3_MYCAM|nr:hypothetical protein QYF61_007198 [Mycteria americana]